LANASVTTLPAAINGFGKEGYYTQEQGFLAYFEICELLEDKSWRKETDDVGSPYIVKGDQWIGYDSRESLATKVSLFKSFLETCRGTESIKCSPVVRRALDCPRYYIADVIDMPLTTVHCQLLVVFVFTVFHLEEYFNHN
jgi:hypothetical protein